MNTLQRVISRTTQICLFACLAVLVAASAQAGISYGFNPVGTSISGAGLTLDVSDAGGGQVAFSFSNQGLTPHVSIVNVYWDYHGYDAFSGITSVSGSSGVNYLDKSGNFIEANPWDLPGGKSIDPAFSSSFGLSPDSKGGKVKNGVGTGETLDVLWSMAPGADYQNLIGAINAGEVRVALHVQDLRGGDSESLVSAPSVPLPPAVWLFGTGLVGLYAVNRRRGKT